MKLTEMRQILASGQIQLTKSLGQNFLHDGNQLRRIAEVAELKPADRVFEVGPGLGPLTELLVAQAGEVLAIEKDQRLFEFVREKFAASKNFFVRHDDALEWIRREKRDWRDWKLVANLPYSVASPILVELAQAHDCPSRMVATLQLEVGNRVMAKAGEDDYGVLSLLLQLRYEPVASFKIPAECFFPAPDVDSACVALERRAQPLLPYALNAKFDRLVKLGFSQRRKMMLKLLKQEWPAEKLAAVFEQLKLSPQIRAERVTLEQFVELVKILETP
ncbi:MAG TPA: 16S rRNA (adenine(1518)-N(6)/adenine(1519)-N(6))-dimethyltransferase RsmA [Verrucomicrobiae bacterium]|jgi:16S rRNA (adenine1518-N6/adenine1519-N6)-dimethyltransferase|nr:16S rRNA (adenine(1518)-N(6)/adenine(1519)-N(6))-dimethyltransferase RsmA [Verrucomicrobiae bacterium]